MTKHTRDEEVVAAQASLHLPRPGCAVIDAVVHPGLESRLLQRLCQPAYVFLILVAVTDEEMRHALPFIQSLNGKSPTINNII